MSPRNPLKAIAGNLQEKMQQARERAFLTPTLNTLQEIVSSMDDAQKHPFLKQINAATARYNDDKLNLAIIGEFSCGKSTFINALFQKEILSINMQPTTAVPTYITWTNRQASAEKGNYAVTVYANDKRTFHLSDANDKKSFQEAFHIELPDNPDSIIDAVTTNNDLGPSIEKVEVAVPYNATYQNIRLIDTPGVNPGTSGTEAHIHATQNVLRESADAAIIMFPCDQVYTASFNNFLQDNASHLLRNSIFVLTKCDLIRSELEKLVDFVTLHLEKLGVKSPKIYCISASYALDAYLSTTTLTSTEEKWKAEFEQTIHSIFKDMASHRTSIIHENVTTVVTKITKLLSDKLEEKKKKVTNAQIALEKNSPKNMKSECNAFFKEATEELEKLNNQYVSSADTFVTGAIEDEKNHHFLAVEASFTKDEISDALADFSKNAVQNLQDSISLHVDQFKESLDDIFKKYKNSLNDCYKRYHLAISTAKAELPDVKIEESKQEALRVHAAGYITGSAFREVADECFDSIDDFMSGNFLEGTASFIVTTLALPFVGVAAIFNMLRSLDAIEREAKQKIKKQLDSVKKPALKNFQTTIANIYRAYSDAVTAMPEQILTTFKKEFENAENVYTRKMEAANYEIKMLSKQVDQLHSISEKLEKSK